MKVIVMKKATVTDISHGKRYSTDVEKIENVSSISEVVETLFKLYQITFTIDDTTTTRQYSQNDYIVNILP